MHQNIYDDESFFSAYAALPRSIKGLAGAPEWPSLKALLPPMTGAKVVDLGCGYGWFCREALGMGACAVTGLDSSQKMLAKAESMTTDARIVYEKQDIATPALQPDHFDLAYSSLALHYLADLKHLYHTVYRALRKGGVFLFSVEHPIFTSPAAPGWAHDSAGNRAWPVNRYQMRGERVTDWMVQGVTKYHRTVGDYVNALIQVGFMLAHLEEWGPDDAQVARNPSLAEERERPMLMLIKAVKPQD